MPFYLNFKVRIWFILLVNIGYYLIKLLNSYLKKIWEVPAWSVRFNNFFPYMDFKYLNYLGVIIPLVQKNTRRNDLTPFQSKVSI